MGKTGSQVIRSLYLYYTFGNDVFRVMRYRTEIRLRSSRDLSLIFTKIDNVIMLYCVIYYIMYGCSNVDNRYEDADVSKFLTSNDHVDLTT